MLKRLTLLVLAAFLVSLAAFMPQPAQAGRMALYIHVHNWSARGAWLTTYECGIFGCDIESAREAPPNRQGSGQYSNFGPTLNSGQKFKLRVEITKPDGQRVDRWIEGSATHQMGWNACIHSDYTFTWC